LALNSHFNWGRAINNPAQRLHIALVVCCLVVATVGSALGRGRPGAPSATPIPAVVQVQFVNLSRAYDIAHGLYPHATIRMDRSSNSLIIVAKPDQVQAIRTILQGIDVRSPMKPTVVVVPLRYTKAATVIARLQGLYPNARLSAASKSSILVRATPIDLQQLQTLINNLDEAPVTPPPPVSSPAEAVRITQASPKAIARALARQIPHLRASVSGASIVLVGQPDDINKAKGLIATLDQPAFGARYTQIYRIRNIDAASVAELVQRSFPGIKVTVDKDLNALSVTGTASQHQRISDAISQLDGAAGAPGAQGANSASGAAYGGSNIEVVELRSAMPAAGQGTPSTTATDIAQAVTQALQPMASDLHVTVPANSNQIVLSGSPQSIRLAKQLIDRLDQPPTLVVLDTEVLELDDNATKNIGLEFPGASISTIYGEMTPPLDSNGNPGRIGRLRALTRTPVQFQAVINLLIQKGNARVLADPRITTISGHTATIRAGDTIGILTQTAGGPGIPITQQLQTFNTGVTLDITPIVNGSNEVTVALHPVVNSLTGILNGVPQIATRDTQTVVHLKDGETLAIGGLIQEETQRSSQRLPLLGDLPIIGGLFRNENLNYTRNELIITVTPHILPPGSSESPPPNAALPQYETPGPLPTLPPNTQLPSPLPQAMPEPPPPPPTPIVAPSPSHGMKPELSTPSASPSPSPAPTPSAFGSTNVFEYGSAPQNTYAGDFDTPQIFYARFTPTVLKQGTPVSVSVVTTTNVRKVTIGVSGSTTSLSSVASSQWQGNYNFNTTSMPASQGTVNLTLSAFRSDGVAATIQIPVSLSSGP